MVDPLGYFTFQPVPHDCGMCYSACVMMHIKEPSERVVNVAAAGFLSRYLSGPLPYVMGRRINPSWGGPTELFHVLPSAPRLV